ncbi:GTPase required for pre-60S ribosomal subunit nuclear export and maturation [Sorochytrium milnesiophthora]
MGQHKKEKNRTTHVTGTPAKTITKMKGENFYRDQKKLKFLNMLKGGKAVRNESGEVVKDALFQSRQAGPARVEPNRKWFGNTRVIGQKQLEMFREEIAKRINDPYQVLLRHNKLPLSLVEEPTKKGKVNMLETESFGDTFGPKSQRKRPKLKLSSVEELAGTIDDQHEKYQPAKDPSLLANQFQEYTDETRDVIFMKGQSKRIWGELYKVIDSSDVVIHVLDARDPLGTRCHNVEAHMKKNAKHKHLVFLLNKCDLVPTWVTARWVKILSREYPTLAFHASIMNPFGKGSLIQLLRQYSKLHGDKKQISVGFVGYPNVGKSSIINTLKKKKVCTVAPIPGETKIWQYITLMRRIYLIDCPGVVYASNDSESDIVLKGVVRVENLKNPEDHVKELVDRVKPIYLRKTYEIESWDSHIDLLEQLARKSGKLLKGGEPDIGTVSKVILNDWLRGKIPYFTAPPGADDSAADASVAEPVDGTVATEADDQVRSAKRTKQQQPSVNQIFSKIPVVASFAKEDLELDKALRNEERERQVLAVAAAASDSSTLAADGAEEEQEGSDQAEDQEQPDWDDIFEDVFGEETSTLNGGDEADDTLETLDDDEDKEDDDEDSEDVAQQDAAAAVEEEEQEAEQAAPSSKQRKTTNKGKVGVHYYKDANIKNKNRNKAKPVDLTRLEKQLKGDGKRKAGGKRKR